MSLDELLYEDACSGFDFSGPFAPFHSLELWVPEGEGQSPIVRDIPVPGNRLQPWLSCESSFSEPQQALCQNIAGRLRLLYQVCEPLAPSSNTRFARKAPFDRSTLDTLTARLHLPRCYPSDLLNWKHVPTRLRQIKTRHGPNLGIVCQSISTTGGFMTVVLSHNPRNNTTSGYLGYWHGQLDNSSPIRSFIPMLKHVSSHAISPVLVPIFIYGLWAEILRRELEVIASKLRTIQLQTGLMDDYLRSKNSVANFVNYDVLHQQIILQHAYLTNGVSDFVCDMGPACRQAIDYATTFLTSNIAAGHSPPDVSDLESYVRLVQTKVSVELQHRSRMLERLNLYLQVLYNLMQQEIARETRRDSSAMKSISLLTMVFLPATAIATVMSPFITVTSNGSSFVVTRHFWVFWAIASPITVVVLLAWLLWQNRIEIANWLLSGKNGIKFNRDRRQRVEREIRVNQTVEKMM